MSNTGHRIDTDLARQGTLHAAQRLLHLHDCR